MRHPYGEVRSNESEHYTAPWVVVPLPYKRIANELMMYYGWRGLFAGTTEWICAEERYERRLKQAGT